jgi:hypothetical protein
MNHPDEDQLILFLYGEGGNEITEHLDVCESCRASYRALQKVLAAVQTLPVPERPQGYGADVWRQLRRRIAKPAATTIIELARTDSSTHVRGQALFWLSQKAGQKAATAIEDAIENDPETEVKKKAVFALSQLPKDDGVPRWIDVARKNRNKEVRKDAMFWLGQSGDPRALAFFEEVLTK